MAASPRTLDRLAQQKRLGEKHGQYWENIEGTCRLRTANEGSHGSQCPALHFPCSQDASRRRRSFHVTSRFNICATLVGTLHVIPKTMSLTILNAVAPDLTWSLVHDCVNRPTFQVLIGCGL